MHVSPSYRRKHPILREEQRGQRPGAAQKRGEHPRIALYSHDTMGLGHARRNLLIAQALASAELDADVLLISGAHETNHYELPPRVDCLSLPSLQKLSDGRYASRRLSLSLDHIVALRSQIIRAAVTAFEPDVMIVDNVPRGVRGELDPALHALRANGYTRCVLGLRDVLDDPAVIAEEWREAANFDTIRAYYDQVWIYGDANVYDLATECQFPDDVAAQVCFTGYLDQTSRLRSSPVDATIGALDLPPGKLVLCLVGGGQDGDQLADAFTRAHFPDDINAVVITGPHMAQATRRRLALRVKHSSRLRVLEFVSEPTQLLQHADRVVAMGGYNTTCELLSFAKHALVVPRVTPRREQLIRAQRLNDLGLIDLLHPGDLSPEALATWVGRSACIQPAVRDIVDMNGLQRLPSLLTALLADLSEPDDRAAQRKEVLYVA